jgi:hypothetical protein
LDISSPHKDNTNNTGSIDKKTPNPVKSYSHVAFPISGSWIDPGGRLAFLNHKPGLDF